MVTSDRLNAAGRPAAAYDQLAPRLAAAPDNPDLNQALARLYATNQQPGKAVRITQTLLDQNPSNLSVRSSAVYARLADGDLGQAAAAGAGIDRGIPGRAAGLAGFGQCRAGAGSFGRWPCGR